MRSSTLLLTALVLASLTLRLVLALGPLENIDGYAIPDDAYLFLDLARSIAHGEGPLYGREWTNGFQPLFAFLLAPLFWFVHGGDGPVHAALVLLALFDTATLLLLLRLVGHATGGSQPAQLFAAAAWVCHPGVVRNTASGMETSVALCFVVLAVSAHRRILTEAAVDWSRGRALAVGATIGLAMLARVDAILLVPALWAWIGWRVRRGRLRIAAPLPTLVTYGLGALLAFAPWIAYSAVYTGDLYPVSGRAVRFQATAHYEMFPELGDPIWIQLRRAGGEIYRGNFVLLAALAAIAAGTALWPAARRAARARAGLLVPLGLHAVLLYLAYATYIGGTWFFHRYLHPVVVPILLAASVGFAAITGALAPRARAWLTAAACALLIAGSVATDEFAFVTGRGRDGNFGYRAIGLWTRDRFPAGTVIGAKQSGAIGYYADRCEVQNLDGVVDRSAFAALREGRMLEFLATRDIDYYVLWEYGAEFIRRFSREPSAHDLVRVETVPGIHSWGNPGSNVFHVYRLD